MSKGLAQQYQKKTDKQHILDNPDTYIGSIENVIQNCYIYDDSEKKIVSKEIDYISGLYKLFDEGIVNCRDHAIRMTQKISSDPDGKHFPVTKIDIEVNDDGSISMFNDGNGIDIVKHPEYDIWIPEMIFGHLRTSTNYDKTEKKIVGGKNGFGFKLVLIWSSIGSVETVDHVRKLKYTQTFENNLDIINKPTITKCSAKPYTRITFKPDYKRFGIDSLSNDMKQLFIKRVYDIASATSKNIKISCNKSLLNIKSFQQYIDLYIGTKDNHDRVYEEVNERWHYAVCMSPTYEFTNISFVNGIYTSKGGKHVEYITNQITKKMITYIEKKRKITVNANAIKEQLMVFIRCDIENPSFDSQTKDYMNTPSNKFGSSCTISDKCIDKIAKMGVADSACAISEIKDTKAAKKSDGHKSKNIRGIPKLIDANWAGTSKSSDCTIIFCEGDSAKAGIVSGLSSIDRNIYGVYPMKGKILNVRGELIKKISENKEIIEIKQILGLETNKVYNQDNFKKLRYGKVLFMTDQDLDGSHIKGLCINLFQHQWTQLSQINNFIGFMNTPILKAKKGYTSKLFYNEGEYTKWKSGIADLTSWKIKYYKGLGTSTGTEFKEYFKDKKIVYFNHASAECDDAIDMVFNKKRADDRKEWLGSYKRDMYLDTNVSNITFKDFVQKEMIHYSKYDCDRSIPNIMDGLKISLRKILYSAFKKNLTTQEIKVAQFSGYVSEHSGYHHGEASLNAAIVGLAQNFVGSNNINLLSPNGQFGTRLQGGKDSASERYIFTLLNKITRTIFHPSDDAVLKYLDDDGQLVEPIYYTPIIPMLLVNGSKGIGTGFSTEVPCYNPGEIITYLRNKLANKIDACSSTIFKPYYEGFTGTIQEQCPTKYLVCGKYTVLSNNKVCVTELPVGYWTEDFKQHLENLAANVDKNGKKTVPIIKEIDDMSKTTDVNIVITFNEDDRLQILESNTCDNGCNGIEKLLKLYTTISTTNMHMFTADEKLKKYHKVNDIIDDYYVVRLEMYVKRKKHIIDYLTNELNVLYNKQRYIGEVLEDTLILKKRKKDEIIDDLKTRGYSNVNDDDYKYLLKMTMDSVSEENVERMNEEYKKKNEELEKVKGTSVEKMWSSELTILEGEYKKFIIARNKL